MGPKLTGPAFVAVYFKTGGKEAGMVYMYAPEYEVLRRCRDLAYLAGAEYIIAGGWSWYGETPNCKEQ